MRRYLRQLILILIVVAAAIYIDLPNSPGIHVFNINRDFETRLGLDLVGGVQALLEADLPEGQEVDPAEMQVARSIVENRVNFLGVNEAVVQQAGDRRIVVELPGESDPERALSAIQQTGLLEFVDMTDLSPEQALVLENTIIQTDFLASETVQPTATVTSTIPTRIYHTVMTGTDLEAVSVVYNQLSEPEVAFTLSSNGSAVFRDFTSANIGRVLAITLDKRVISTPTINQAITDGQGVITGRFTTETANTLAAQLRSGSLPVPLRIVETRTVGPTLGQDSLRRSLIAGIVGFAVVVLFMALYYRLPGLVADLVILIYALVAFALFRSIPITLTLPGIAGFLLSTGSALDANILIFERLKEELRRGRTLRQAVDLGWQRAWPSIRDSNIATLLTCGILFYIGSAFGATIVKGFSLTLAMGVAVSLFTAILVTRTILNLVLEVTKPTDLPRWFGL